MTPAALRARASSDQRNVDLSVSIFAAGNLQYSH